MTVVSELRRLLAQATPAEWCRRGRFLVYAPWSGDPEDTYVGNVADAYHECDAALIVALRNHADALLEVVEAARRYAEMAVDDYGDDSLELAQLQAALARLDGKETP